MMRYYVDCDNRNSKREHVSASAVISAYQKYGGLKRNEVRVIAKGDSIMKSLGLIYLPLCNSPEEYKEKFEEIKPITENDKNGLCETCKDKKKCHLQIFMRGGEPCDYYKKEVTDDSN